MEKRKKKHKLVEANKPKNDGINNNRSEKKCLTMREFEKRRENVSGVRRKEFEENR